MRTEKNNMALELKQQIKLSQQLVMTQRLQQAISLLQLSRLELVDTISSELMENPFLEEGSEEFANDQTPQENQKNQEDDFVYDKEVSSTADWEDYLGDLSSSPKLSNSKEFELPDEMMSYESRYASSPNLESHLMWQLYLANFTDEEMNIGEYIIGNINDNGYLSTTLHEISIEVGVDESSVRKVLEAIQNFDPVGVAASDPKESLLIQIKNLKYDRDPILLGLITNHLEDLEAFRYKHLMKKFKIDEETLYEYIQIIKSLDPMPGSGYSNEQSFYISPDAFIYEMNGDYIIVLNEDGIPQLQLSEIYSQMSMTNIDATQKEFLIEKQKAATWLIRAVHQRQKTLYKVLESIVKYQTEFFSGGVTKLKPLILKTVAEDIGMHESTISRITTNKFVATAYGTFEIKFFFNSALSLDSGAEVGSESVKSAIKKYISEEDTKNPLSDEKLCEILKNDLGVDMARRTVAKYRTALNIPSSSKRKSFF